MARHQPTHQRAVVVGGSLGGLTAALLLRDLGWEVDVFERSPAKLSGFGAGIVVHPASMRYFRERSSVDPAAISVPSSRFQYLDESGTVVHRELSPYSFISWGTLYGSLIELFDADRYHNDHTLVALDQDGREAEAVFSNGRRERCDLLVCADGILSTARGLLAPGAGPIYAGYVGWRGTVDEQKLGSSAAELLADAITYGLLDHSHILAYPIQKPGPGGGLLLNFVWYRNVPKGAELDALMVDDEGRRRPISIPPGAVPEARVRELRDEAAEVLPSALAELVRSAEEPFIQAVVDVTVDAMAYGRVCLIGDAAFAARPHAAAGTAKAAENGWTLVDAIAANGEVTRALEAWEPEQIALGNALVDRSRRLGELYQVRSAAVPGDRALRFGLRGPDD